MKAIEQSIPNSPATRTLGSVCLASCQKLLAQIEQTRNAILAEFRGTLAAHEHLLRLAVNEAEALAWQTGFPHLLFPALAMEKVRAVAAWHERQESAGGSQSRLARPA